MSARLVTRDGEPERPFLITDEGPEDVDTSEGLLLDDYPDWMTIGALCVIALGLVAVAALLGFAAGYLTYGWRL